MTTIYLTDHQKRIIVKHYERLSTKYIAKRLGMRVMDVYCAARKLGLRKCRQKPKADIIKRPKALTSKPAVCKRPVVPVVYEDPRVNPTGIPHVSSDEALVPLRIDSRTVIMIPAGADPNERRMRFLKKLNAGVKSQPATFYLFEK
ncbi:MAG: hypothetical protein LBQ39_07035 [Tannerellaceae bacterium]|jgi:hypothetical protein|nr:hypothetical protein [Tannerellaceae bacterium]